MPKQPAIPGLGDAVKKKVTRREKFLSEMDAVVPWGRLLALIEPHYPKVGSKGGRPPMPLETMLRVYFLQSWYALSDPMAEESLYDSEAMRRFAGIELGDDRIPDETTILNFRHLLEKHQLTEKLFAEVNAYLADKGVTLRSGTLVDATIIDAPSSTKNEAKARDPEMSSTKKGNDWYFGMKAHVGVDADSGIVHSLETTTAKTHDSQVWDELLHGNETSVWADKGYVHSEREAAFTKDAGRFWGVMRKAPKGGELDPLDVQINRIIAKVRAKVEHPFRILKRQFGHVKTRYRGLAKNRAHLFTLFALGNLFMTRRKLAA
ncbi:IS5/IS1182 family transposase [Sulfitobacter sp. JL08]|uniref:IS5 family transposase n=1 Tax=Sulfitobacter sp. JL08 TaxID=2070369 RepID=UPI000E0BA520|nr:IS5 family transposase [Sulfitobacter sp. JL08]AXI53271.1 IS5/IS1182 family transposase [Sulfitobacter sp. JL08]AXI53588.1 IS5/IS1182 family transposase [Sulfitobacter sp. JL08]AXI53843.1 IS5/IS1182 family transposase [Sulfitobacter sp. JL08]AXI53984.1 IS5/IS1182 family transposase [Sulfitobacter sp. JL08]AXI54066.1 IS5/IS1182 family transposase [Sulfitobacter sp. JL08]